MKQLLFTIIIICFTSFITQAQSNNASGTSLEAKMQNATLNIQRYKMLQTDNMHILLKWDSRTGSVWIVQYALPDTKALTIGIPDSFIISEEKSWNGRFELYPTKNTYNFIMIDTFDGTTYQIQWSLKVQNSFSIPL